MKWNHRVLVFKEENDYYFEIQEVYYNDKDIAEHHTSNISVGSENVNGLNWTLNKMQECLKKPVLWAGEKFPQEAVITYECLICGRNKFTRKSPHNCGKVFRKRNINWRLNCQ